MGMYENKHSSFMEEYKRTSRQRVTCIEKGFQEEKIEISLKN